MALYAALLYYDTDRYWTDESEAEHLAGYDDFEQAAAAAGVSRGGQALQPPSTAATIAVAGHRDGELTVTDGPFAETKEVLGGFYLLEAPDIDEAFRWAARIPAAWRGKVEVRPVVHSESMPPSPPEKRPR